MREAREQNFSSCSSPSWRMAQPNACRPSNSVYTTAAVSLLPSNLLSLNNLLPLILILSVIIVSLIIL